MSDTLVYVLSGSTTVLALDPQTGKAKPVVSGLQSAVSLALDAAKAAESENISLEVIDLRSLSPLDMGTILASLRKTHRAVVVHEAPVFGGFGAEIAARISDDGFDLLQAPVARVGAMDAPYPPSRYEKLYLPDVDRILEAVDVALAYG